MRCFSERMALLAVCTLSACATTQRVGAGGRGNPVLAGVWEGQSESTLGEGPGAGDKRIEKQAWRLTQKGVEVSGFYVVELTMISGDGRPYLCSREPRFSTILRFDVKGRVTPAGIYIDEVGEVQSKGPCRPSFHSPARYRAALTGDILTLSDGERQVALYRRNPAAGDPVAQTLLGFEANSKGWSRDKDSPGGDPARSENPADPPADIEGLWVWEHRGPLPGGDEKVEREEWHLVQDGNRISGYYDRAVHQISTDGHAYRCNSALDFRVVTRYQINGEVAGSAVTLYEKGFEILQGSPCDDGRRRLDAYQGQAGTAEIRLMWGVGTQVLKRARPNVPTQRF
jgi:hypothetical protein